jgi:hypothetical protein
MELVHWARIRLWMYTERHTEDAAVGLLRAVNPHQHCTLPSHTATAAPHMHGAAAWARAWLCGGVAVWRCGGVAVWRCGGVAVCDGVAVWGGDGGVMG